MTSSYDRLCVTSLQFPLHKPLQKIVIFLCHLFYYITVQVYAEAFLATATSGTSGAKEAKEKATRDEIKELYHKAFFFFFCTT